MPRRRGWHEGTVYRRKDGLWVGRVRFEGTRHQVSARAERDCRRRLRELVRALEKGAPPQGAGRRQTLAQVARAWLAETALTRPASHPSRTSYLEHHLLAHPVAAKRVGALTTADLTALYRERLAAGYAPSTVKELHTKVKTCLAWAARRDVPVAPSVLGMKPPAAGRVERTQLSPAEVALLFRATADDPLGCLWRLTWYCATRLGEALALRWSDVEGRRVLIRRVLVGVRGGEPTYREAKTAASVAAVPIPLALVEALIRHRARQEERRRALGPAWKNLGLVFDRGDGASLGHSVAERAFYRSLKAAGLPRCRVHDLRGASGSALLEAGHGLVDIQRRLRHADVGTTVGSYLQPTSEADERAADTLERLVSEGN